MVQVEGLSVKARELERTMVLMCIFELNCVEARLCGIGLSIFQWDSTSFDAILQTSNSLRDPPGRF